MEKCAILYNPMEDASEASDDDRTEDKWIKIQEEDEEDEDPEETVDDEREEVKTNETSECEIQSSSEVPLKLIKLDSPGEALVA